MRLRPVVGYVRRPKRDGGGQDEPDDDNGDCVCIIVMSACFQKVNHTDSETIRCSW